MSSKKQRQRARRQAARKKAKQRSAQQTGEKPVQRPAKTQSQQKVEERPEPSAETPATTKKAERLEKRESARQSRIEAARRRQRARRRKRLLAVILVAVVVGSVAVFFVARAAQNRDRYQREIRAAGCETEIRVFDEQNPQHIDAENAPPRVPYNSDPPTSGDHAGSQTAPWDIFDETLPPETFVHNLEHGGTVIHYKGLSDEQIERLEGIVEDNPDTVLMMPNESIDKPIVLTAWRAMQTCERVNTFVIEEFIKRRCNKSPEPGSDCGSGGGGGTAPAP